MISVYLHLISIVTVLLFATYEALYIMLNGRTSIFLKFVALVAIIAVGFLASQRATYLPFLGKSAVPASLLKDATVASKSDISVKVDVDFPDNTKVMYWASKPSANVVPTPTEAYANSTNAGIAVVKNSKTTFYIECPASYNVTLMTLKPHVHYRVVLPNGMLGEVQTMYVDCGKK